jgi:hypothetical protein
LPKPLLSNDDLRVDDPLILSQQLIQ